MNKVGIDFGGTQIKAALVQGADILRDHTVNTPAGGDPERVLDALAEAALGLGVKADSVGLAIPGETKPSGEIYRLPNVPGFEGVNIATELAKRLGGTRVFVENDATAAAHGEALFGHGRTYSSFMMITLGTGVGGGVVLGGTARGGVFGFAGEVGHVRVRTDNPALCACGQRGCVEAYAGTGALLRECRALGGKCETPLDVAELARAGSAAGLGAFTVMAEALGALIVTSQNILDLDAYVFTGGISRSFDLIEGKMRSYLKQHSYADCLAEVPLLLSGMGARAGVVGAAHLDERAQHR